MTILFWGRDKDSPRQMGAGADPQIVRGNARSMDLQEHSDTQYGVR
jgi:hypothetical protein